MEEIKVSVICNAFNHEEYIKDALNGFIKQKTNFKYEVLIHDDASTDKTADIIREYEKKYPEIIKPIYQKINQYSQGISITRQFQYPRVKGKYIALCEGDDYWTDPLKLQKQYNAMEKHPELDICAHTVTKINAVDNKKIGKIFPAKKDCIFSVEEVIKGGGGFVGTVSLFYRSTLINDIPDFFKYYGIDYMLQINGALRGGMLFLFDTMANYRVLVKNSWTQKFKNDDNAKISHLRKISHAMNLLNEYTKFEFNDCINYMLLSFEFKEFYINNNYDKLLQNKYRVFFKNLPLRSRIKIRFPITKKIRDFIKKGKNK